MNKEEQQAYFAKQEQEMLNKCRIKTEEQFLFECRAAGVPAEWYAFTCDGSKPVSMDEKTVYYRKFGKTIVMYPFQRWDIAFDELLRYKEEHEWECSGAAYRITAVEWISDANIASSYGGAVTLREYRFSEGPEQDMIDDGWTYDRYDGYMGHSVYHKTVSSGSVMRDSFILFEFTKRTDKRDAETFGFSEGSYLNGSFKYPVPQDLRARIRSERDFPVRISDELCGILTERLAKDLIEYEFYDLCAFQEDVRKALCGALDPALSEREQKTAFAEAFKRSAAGHPAFDNRSGSRCDTVIQNELERAYRQAGI